MIKLSIINYNSIINKSNDSIYMLDSISLWHYRLAHVGLSKMKGIIKNDLISCDTTKFKICEFCVELCVMCKMTKKPFK